MRFYLGETYEGDFPTGLRYAVVVDIAEGGLRGTLRFADTEEVLHATLWGELHKAGKWRRLPQAANDETTL